MMAPAPGLFLTSAFQLALLVLFPHAHAYNVSISPSHIHTSNPIGVQILCEAKDGGAPVALSGCQFLYQSSWNSVRSAIMDLSSGSSSRTPGGSTYHGTGLQNGQCGITLGDLQFTGVLGCRVREDGGRWSYQTMAVYNDGWENLNYSLQPPVVFARAGSNVDLTGKANHVLSLCSFRMSSKPRKLISFNDGQESRKTSSYRYYGTGLQDKQCGITVLNVTGEDSGFIEGAAWASKSDIDAISVSTLIVQTPPDKPTLTVTSSDLMEGEMLKATCVVANSRPVSNITWLLGDRVVRDDLTNEAPAETDWLWSYELQSITQHLLLRVTLEDNGKQLVCRASHGALASGSLDSTAYVINVRAK